MRSLAALTASIIILGCFFDALAFFSDLSISIDSAYFMFSELATFATLSGRSDALGVCTLYTRAIRLARKNLENPAAQHLRTSHLQLPTWHDIQARTCSLKAQCRSSPGTRVSVGCVWCNYNHQMLCPAVASHLRRGNDSLNHAMAS